MELRVLRYFLAVADHGNITKAADFLHITQPTLSRQLKDLEKELNLQLFIRSSHNVILTPEGALLRQRAGEILDMVQKTKNEFNTVPSDISGDIYIGGGETGSMRLIAGIIKELQQKYPNIRYHLYSGNAENVTERLDKGLLDFGVLIQPTDVSSYCSISLPEKDVWGVIMPKDCSLAQKASITKADLTCLPLICSQQAIRQTPARNDFKNWFGKDFEKLNIVATYNLVFNAALLAEQKIGYVLSLDRLIDSMNSNVCFRPFSPRLESGLDIVWKKNRIFSPAARIFLETLHKKFGPGSSPEP